MLIKEPELRGPIALLPALMTGAIALLIAVLHFVISTRSPVNRSSPPQVEWMLQPGQPDFDRFSQQIAIEQSIGSEKLHPLNDPTTRGVR
jgi:hypothetical protein